MTFGAHGGENPPKRMISSVFGLDITNCSASERMNGRFELYSCKTMFSTVKSLTSLYCFSSSLCCENDSCCRRSHCCEHGHSYALMLFCPRRHSVQPNVWLGFTQLALKALSVISPMHRASQEFSHFYPDFHFS